ncbi:MAG: MBL fold metallo-hydrolase, partial [Thermoplasmatota archaeon]
IDREGAPGEAHQRLPGPRIVRVGDLGEEFARLERADERARPSIAQEDEIRYAYQPDRFQKGGYLAENFHGSRFQPVRGEVEVAPGVTVVPTPGHTPGHQSVVVETDDEVVIYTGDVSPLSVNHERMLIVGILHDPVKALRSLEKLNEMSSWWPEKPKKFIYSHSSV